MMVSNRKLLFQVSIFGCHVSFRGCNCWVCILCFILISFFVGKLLTLWLVELSMVVVVYYQLTWICYGGFFGASLFFDILLMAEIRLTTWDV